LGVFLGGILLILLLQQLLELAKVLGLLEILEHVGSVVVVGEHVLIESKVVLGGVKP